MPRAKRKFIELTIKDIVNSIPGGEAELLKGVTNSDEAYSRIWDAQESLIDALFESGYDEVVEESNTALTDWACNRFED